MKSNGLNERIKVTADRFNLIDERWLPLRRRSGALSVVEPWRITERIDEDPFVEFAWPRADFNGAAHELLIGLLSTAAAPDDDDAWEEWWRCPPAPDVVRQRFTTFAHAFDLHGDGPRFLQDIDALEGTDAKDAAALLIEMPGAQTLRNNADLFVKRGGVEALSRAAAAMALFTLNSFAPSGGAGHRTSLRGGGPMITLIVAAHPEYGDTLWGRLWPNVESREQLEERAPEAKLDDDPAAIFPWLVPTRTSNPKAGGKRTTPSDIHPLQVYWGMPRRIRLVFEDARTRRCGLTGAEDTIVVTSYRTRNYGTDYSEGFEHPLTPYYRPKPSAAAKLPMHPHPGGVNYRLWPGLVVPSKDGLREPAQAVRQWRNSRALIAATSNAIRFAAFGYDMDNMKARAWVEGEMPLWRIGGEIRQWIDRFVSQAITGANTVTRLLTRQVKSALYDRPNDARGDYAFISERFYRETEEAFHEAVRDAVSLTGENPDSDDPTLEARERWAPAMSRAALRLFDEYAPSDGLEDRNMYRHVKARFLLELALGGRGRAGRSLFDGDLGIASPETARSRRNKREAA